jgi:tripartite-type tricarboxylate transporter receptor subunit TctC
MKHILLAFLLAASSGLSTARELVTVVFAFGAGDSVANYGRTLVEEANRIQDRYQFMFDTKPGAGGTIAAQHVGKTPNTILATSAAFFVRPNVYPKDSHAIDQYAGLMIQCTAPMAIGSVKYRTWDEVPKDQNVTFGITGLGATSHLVSMQIQKRFPKLILVPFKSPSDANAALAGGHIDMTVGFLSEFSQWSGKNNTVKINTLGVTGRHAVQGVATLASQGFEEVENMGNPQQLIVSRSVPVQQQQEWNTILTKAALAQEVKRAYEVDACVPAVNSFKQTQQLFDTQTQFWRKITANVNVQ